MALPDEKLARGLAREVERHLLRAEDPVRHLGFSLATELLDRNRAGRKIDSGVFNPALVRLARAARDVPTTLRTEQTRLRLGQPGCYRRLALQREPVEHFRAAEPDFTTPEWTVPVDQIVVERGAVMARFWTAPVLFDPHLIMRYLGRGGAGRQEKITHLIDSALPLATLYRSRAFHAGNSFRPADVVLPAPGGVLCGGTELVCCAALAHRFTAGRHANDWTVNLIAEPTTLHPVAALRTYIDDALLTPDQRRIAAALRDWMATHEAALRADPLAAYGWEDSAGRHTTSTALLAAFEPLHTAAQAAFTTWQRTLERDGYHTRDFRAIALAHEVPGWRQQRADPELLHTHRLRAAGAA